MAFQDVEEFGESQTALDSIRIMQKLKGKPSTVLFIGETGSGKTTFMELLLNYQAQYGREFDLKLVKSMIPKDADDSKCSSISNLQMASDTKASKKYELDFGDLIQLEVIDTPGFGDTEGKEMDKIQISNIIEKVKGENYINCVAIIINGSRSRLTSFMRDVLQEITTVLPGSILSNMIVVLTNAKNVLEANFNPKILHQEFNLSIEKNNIVYLQNPFAIWSKAKQLEMEFPQSLADDFIEAFKLLHNIFSSIKLFPSVRTNSFGDFYQVTENLAACFNELQLHEHNISKMMSIQQGETLRKKNFCYSKERNVTCKLCYNNCHINCECLFADFFLFAFFCNRFLLENGLKCSECGHHFLLHVNTHFYYQTEEFKILTDDSSIITADSPIEAITLAEVKEDIQNSKKKTKIVTDRMFEHLHQFQIIASSFWQNKTRSNALLALKEAIKSVRCIDQKKVIGMIDDACTISQNPFTPVTFPEVKIRWACGLLGIKDNDVSEERIKAAFRKSARFTHPDKQPDKHDQEFVKLNHAREYLLNLPIETVKQHMPKSQKS